MSRYLQQKIRTRLTTHHKFKLIPILVSESVILILVSCALITGPRQDCAPTVSQTLPSMVVQQEHIRNDLPEPVLKYSYEELIMVAQTLWGEARGCSTDEQMLVAWCICNRATERNQSIEQVVTAAGQFHGYNSSNPVEDQLLEAAEQVLQAWSRNETAMVLHPYATNSNYQYFYSDGKHNWFREEF